jgi:hypothetical protein
MVGRVTWLLEGQEYGLEVKCGESEDSLMSALESALHPMLVDLVRIAKEVK